MVFEKIRSLLAEQLEISEDSIRPETRFTDDLGIDSLDIVELISSLEDEFGIVVTDEKVTDLKPVGDLTDFVSTLI